MTSATVRFDGAGSSVTIATAFGPRIVGLLVGDRNMFVELGSDDTLDGPAGRPYRLRGGHRLWVAPEISEVTYQPDDEPCSLTRAGDAIRVDGPVDGAGIAKSITITATNTGWIVDHTIENRGRAAVRMAPWAISQFPPGGRVTLGLEAAGDGLQPDRAVVLWPYTDPTDERLSIGADEVGVAATAGPALKVGVAGAAGTGRYERDGTRIDKRIAVDRDAPYADLGAAVQAFVCDRFCEVETLGPLTVLDPGDAVEHREEWIIS